MQMLWGLDGVKSARRIVRELFGGWLSDGRERV